jgi:hypothetical protein
MKADGDTHTKGLVLFFDIKDALMLIIGVGGGRECEQHTGKEKRFHLTWPSIAEPWAAHCGSATIAHA